MGFNKPIVSVAMSTYNGEKYIAEQIDSILNQEGVQVFIVIRDDGSEDSTVNIIEEYLDRGNIRLIKGKNIGFGRSFMQALFACEDSDYYAFSDQDDVWFPDKLIKTINNMNYSNGPQLGFCSSYYTDEELCVLSKSPPPDTGFISKEMGFVSYLASGYKIVINNSFFNLLKIAGSEIPISHDMWVGGVAGYLADISFLDEKLVYHRRLANSASKLNLLTLITNRAKAVVTDLGVNIRCAELMLNSYADYLKQEDIEYFSTVQNYRNNWKDKIRIMRNKRIYYPSRYGRITPKIKILFNRF